MNLITPEMLELAQRRLLEQMEEIQKLLNSNGQCQHRDSEDALTGRARRQASDLEAVRLQLSI
jgi:hypothetical protein